MSRPKPVRPQTALITVVIPGLTGQLLALTPRFVPRSAAAQFVRRLHKRALTPPPPSERG